MTRELGLSGAELLVYAIVLSFTLGAAKIYFGSAEYIAELAGLSPRSVHRALRGLRESGLVYDAEIMGRVGLRARQAKRDKSEPCDKGQIVSEKRTNCHQFDDKMSPPYISDNKEDNKEITTTPTPYKKLLEESEILSRGADAPLPAGDFCDEEDEEDYEDGESIYRIGGKIQKMGEPQLSVRVFGDEGIVTMTREQYRSLVALVGEETLKYYIERLEALLLSAKGCVYPHSHYRTLRSWLIKDFSA